MKTKYYFLTALASVMLAGCSSDDFVAEGPTTAPEGVEGPIVFSSLKGNYTRADYAGKDAAALLNNKFVVYGYKGASTATPGTTVFDNYAVEYGVNTANTTESNTNNWEYVAVTPIKHATDNGISSQTIKYWDFSKPQYDFIAWSTGTKTPIYEGTPADGQVLVSAITPATIGTKAYTFTGKAADLSACYIADLVTVGKAKYGNDPVTFKFRQLGTKVRIALYETVPGYSVKNVEFYSAAASDDASAAAAKLFTTTANDIYTEGTYTVTYPTVDAAGNDDNNQAHVSFVGSGSQSTLVNWGALNYSGKEDGEKTAGDVFLGRTSSTASFAGNAADNYYVVFMPNETGTNLNLRVDFTLEAIDGGGETIEVKNAKAQVPSIYTTWKPGFAYTYLFKISDKTNGRTGVYDPTQADDATVNSDPAGLYPITFDAVVVNAEDNDKTQETITTVMTPSITTYQSGSTVIDNNEYTTLTPDPSKGITGDIYVTVNENNTTVKLTGKANVYSIPAGKTEAEVVDALQMQDDDAATGTIKGRSGLVLTEVTCKLIGRVNYGVDGNSIIVGSDKVAYFTPTANTTYAFVYTKTAPTSTTDKFQVVTKADGADVNGLYRFALTAAPAGDVQKGVTYFDNNGASANAITAFLGQGVSNLYTRSGAGTDADPYVYSIASGYAVTGTTYYYTLDHGLTYQAATPIALADFATADLYHDAAKTEAKTETKPTDGQAYYDNTGKYCVIMPQQTTGLYVIDELAAKVACGSTDTAVNGMTYFDKFTQNNGVYYTKVIKVQ